MLSEEKILKYSFLFCFGGMGYFFIEIASRGHSHYSMIICGGLCFVLCGMINQIFGFDVPLLAQMILSGILITVLEFLTGLIVNVWLQLDVWDYSQLPYNVMGQICLPYTCIWMVLSLVCIFADDWIRYYIFQEEKPRYKIV